MMHPHVTRTPQNLIPYLEKKIIKRKDTRKYFKQILFRQNLTTIFSIAQYIEDIIL